MRTELKEHADDYHSGARETRVKGTVTGRRRRSGVARHDRYQCVGYDEGGGGGDKVGDMGVIPGPQWTTAFGSIYIRTADLLWAAFGRQLYGPTCRFPIHCPSVIGPSTQVAWRLLVHRGGAQVPRLGSQKKTTIAGLDMVEQEARGLAGTGSRHGRNATSMETMDIEDRAVCMEVQALPQGGPSSRSIHMVTT
ncbi:uncharacterized protein UHOD_11300 [Ustilago sp. UG-2017b]|nr:uncharacterized protein UHOD_11300 [Ustilago sp. UG-2017b]